MFSDGQNHTLIFDEPSWSLDGYVLFNNNENATIINNSIIVPEYMSDIITAYRKYTPGHWEYPDGHEKAGQWVEDAGSWSEWQGIDNTFVTYDETEGWIYSVTYTSNVTDENANVVLFTEELLGDTAVGYRTWTPNPSAPTE